ncbi:fimbrial protein [Vibrio parahaemolyticus]
MKPLTKQICRAFLLLCSLFSFNNFASNIEPNKLESAAKHIASMSSEQKQAAHQAIGQLSAEQKAQIKNTLKEKYNDLSDDEKARLKSQLSGFAVSHPQLLKANVDKLSEADKQRIVQQIVQQTEKKLRAMPITERQELYTKLKKVTTPQQRLKILSAAIGRIGWVTYGVTGDEILAALKGMSLEELATLFDNLATAINDSIYSDTMLGSDLYQLFSGLSDVIGNAADNMGDETAGKYIPLLMRTPHAAKCRTEGAISDGEAIECDVSERNAFWVSSPYAAGRIVEKQSLFITLTCAEGWSAEGEYCTHPSIPGAGVKAQITFDGDVITSGGERYELVYDDHFNVEKEALNHNGGGGPHAIDDNDAGCSEPTLGCRMGDGLYHSESAGFDGALTVNVTWSLLHPAEYEVPTLSETALKNLHPFNVEYQQGDEATAGGQALKDQGAKNMFIVTNFETVATSCEVTSPEQTVDLGTVWAGDVDRGIVEGSLKPFEIGLSCTGTQTDYMPYINITTAAETGMEMLGGEVIGYLKNEYVGANAAENVGIAIYADLPAGRVAIPAFNTVTNYAQTFDLSADANPTLKFQAAFFKPDPVVMGELKAGKFEANITVNMVYP